MGWAAEGNDDASIGASTDALPQKQSSVAVQLPNLQTVTLRYQGTARGRTTDWPE